MIECIFCKIAKGEAPSFKIWENDEFIAFLDLNPNVKGQTLIIPKEHYDSDLFLINEEGFMGRLMDATQEVVNMLKKSLKVERVGMIMEGMGVNHLHLKLYPMYGLGEGRKPIECKGNLFFDTYPGYLTTRMGDQANMEELGAIQVQITNGAALN